MIDLRTELNGKMINIILMQNEGIVVVEPVGPLKKADFEKLAKEIDAHSGNSNRLAGLIIHTRLFPGWDDFNAFLQHMKFVKQHHKAIKRIAIVTDSIAGKIGPVLAHPCISAQIKHFEYDNLKKAEQWLNASV